MPVSPRAEHALAVQCYLVRTFVPDIAPTELPVDYDLVGGGIIDSLSAFAILAWLIETFDLTPGRGCDRCRAVLSRQDR